MLAAVDLVAVASGLGSRPWACFALMMAVALLGLLFLVVAVRWSDAHARRIWGAARGAMSRFAARPRMRALEARIPWVWRTMRTLTASEYLLVHVAIGLAAAFAGLIFVGLGQSVGEGETTVAIDLALARALHAAASPLGVELMSLFSTLGGSFGIPLFGISIGLIFALRRQWLLFHGWAIALSGAGFLNLGLKAVFTRARPLFETPFGTPDGWSFPSGHSMVTLVAAGMIAYFSVLFVKSPTRRLLAVFLALIWTVSMGFSRMYLGMHYLSDVVAGFAAGLVWLGACVTGLEIARRRPGGGAAAAS